MRLSKRLMKSNINYEIDLYFDLIILYVNSKRIFAAAII